MTLKNLMEKKQLNFDQPFLSVRRGSLTGSSPELNKKNTNNSDRQLPALPYYKSDLKSGPVRDPGAVPFQWEQTPGRPKYEKKTERLQPAPRLPPGRIINHKKKPTNYAECNSPTSSSRSHSGSNVLCSPRSEFEGFGEGKRDQTTSSSDEENVVYEDARDALYRTETSSYNCSLSGVSGMDGPSMGPSGPLLDLQARDFMMGRFLPAAKAVASESPQFGPRKQHVAREQPRPVMKVVTNQSPIDYNIPSTSPYNVHKELEVDEEEDDVDDFDDEKELPAKLCGLLPRFCLLNPIPGMRDQAHIISSVHGARPYGGMRSKTGNKDTTRNYLSEVKRITYPHGSTNKSTPTAHFGDNGNTPWKNDSSLSFLRDRGFRGLLQERKDSAMAPKLDPKFEALLADHNVEETVSPVSTTSEKTLYIDYKSMIDSEDSNPSSFGSRGIKPSDCPSRKGMKLHLGPEQGALSETKNSDIVDAWLLSSSDNRCENDGKDALQASPKDQNVDLVLNTDLSKKSHVEAANRKSGPSLVLAPFLPKSPSESWLSRTLPSMSTKHTSSKLYSGNVALKTSHLDNKRDRLLKTPNGQHLFLPSTGGLEPIWEN